MHFQFEPSKSLVLLPQSYLVPENYKKIHFHVALKDIASVNCISFPDPLFIFF